MPVLVIDFLPESLHLKLKQTAAAHRRSVNEETIHLLERALASEVNTVSKSSGGSYWAARALQLGFAAALQAGAFSGGEDSTQSISSERDAQ